MCVHTHILTHILCTCKHTHTLTHTCTHLLLEFGVGVDTIDLPGLGKEGPKGEGEPDGQQPQPPLRKQDKNVCPFTVIKQSYTLYSVTPNPFSPTFQDAHDPSPPLP